MIKPIHSPFKGKLRVVGYASGSGNTLWKALELQKELEKTFEGSPFEIVGVFSDNPNSKAIETAKQYNIPSASLNIREYYENSGKPLKDRGVRAQYDTEAMELIKPFNADLIILAGYVWATTDIILDNYTVVNVHPADLSIEKDGKRAYAGANGVGDALSCSENYLCSTSHLATKELDGGPILLISPKIPVDYNHDLDKKEFYKHYLKLVNDQSRLVGAHAILEIALGHFGHDKQGNLHYKGKPVTHGVRIESWEENKPLHTRPIEKLINPRSIAVIGASAKGGIGQAIINNINSLEYTGEVYAVNRNGADVSGAKGYSSILDINKDIDLAIITVPSNFVLDVAEECGRKGVKAMVCISAGFKEVGGIGIENEEKLMNIVNKYNMRMLGPNCMGILNTHPKARLNATILHNVPSNGNIGFVTQSGALGAALLDFADNLGLGFSIIASLGNQPDVNINDLLPLLAEDEQTKVILLYLESIPEPVRFAQIASKITSSKPIIIIKSGRTSAGASAASSHTGSLAGNDKVADALIQKSGCIRVNTLEEAFNLSSALSKMPKIKGNRVGIVTNAGGPGILVADSLSFYNFEVPRLNDIMRTELASQLLPEASTSNPIDIVAPAPPSHYAKAAEIMLKSDQYDALLVVCVPPVTIDTGKVAEELVHILSNPNIPVLTCFFGPTLGEPARNVLKNSGIPSFEYPEQLAQILSLMRDNSCKNNLDNVNNFTIDALEKNNIERIIYQYESNTYLPTSTCESILKSYKINIAGSGFISSLNDIENLDINFPVVAKIDHVEIVHKSDVGGVILNIKDKSELYEKTSYLLTKFPGARGVQVQEQIPQGLELILGSSKDPNLGHTIMLGLGGIMVEIFKDITFGHVPLNENIIDEMIKGLRCYPILEGYRGKKGVNLNALKDQILKLNQLLLDFPEIEELDLNPIIYSESQDKFIAADCRIKIC